MTVLIPALKPGERLLGVIDGLLAIEPQLRIILVNDGSPPEYDPVFTTAAQRPSVTLLRHEHNLGKGAALRTGIRHFLDHAQENEILVTADADGQHLAADILAVAARAAQHPQSLVLGCRAFAGQVPWRSRFGNNLTRYFFRLFSGLRLTDTQTGLRAIPRALLPRLLSVKASRYEFELEMLMLAMRQGISFETVPIQTVYLDGNNASHFHPLFDSLRVYSVFARYLPPATGTSS